MSENMKGRLTIEIMRLPHGAGLDLPEYQSDGASGIDLAAAVEEGTEILIEPGARALVPTGLAMAIPHGWEAQVRPRSGLAAKHGITVLNTPGTIDSDYRGEIKVILVNHGDEAFPITRGDRIAQLVFQKIEQAELREVHVLGDSARGSGGFGSTGKS